MPVPVDREGRVAAVNPGWESDGAPPLRLQQGTRTMAVDAGTKRVSYGRETVDDARLAIDMDAVYERIRSRDVIMEDVVSGEEVVLEDRSLSPASHKSGDPNLLTINKDELREIVYLANKTAQKNSSGINKVSNYRSIYTHNANTPVSLSLSLHLTQRHRTPRIHAGRATRDHRGHRRCAAGRPDGVDTEHAP